MKRLLAAVAVAFLALSATGCVVTSVYPFYSDSTVVFDPALLGKWLDDDGKTIWTFAKEGEKAYRVEATERGSSPQQGDDRPETTAFVVHLFRLGGSQFIDAFPAKTDDLAIGGHFLVRVELEGDALTIRALDVDAFDRLAGPRGTLSHVHRLDDGTVVQKAGGPGLAGTLLIAPTADLQAFVQEHGSSVFENELSVMKRVK